MRNLNADQVPLKIVEQGIEDTEDKNSFLKVLEKSYIFLIKFVRNNPENQHRLVEHLEDFMGHIEYGVHAWELVAEIFRNSDLLLSYPIIPHLKKVIKLIDSLPQETLKKTNMMSFLGYFMKYDNEPRKNL